MARRLTHEEFKNRVLELEKGKYTLLDKYKYKNNRTKVLIKHNECGHEYLVTPSGFTEGNRCPSCCFKQRGAKHKTTEVFKEELYSLFGDEYKLVGEYTGVKDKILLEHKECGSVNETIPNTVLSGRYGCLKCARKYIGLKNRITHKEFCKRIEDVHGDKLTILGKYTRMGDKILVVHNVCGFTWEARAGHLVDGTGCPKCKESLGEKMVGELLENRGIIYEPQKKFPGLVYKRQLSYDFYLPTEKVLIEYQGLQHYEPVSFGEGACPHENFKYQQIRDSIKRYYAKNNGYNLIEIPYTEDTYDSIEYFINRELHSVV